MKITVETTETNIPENQLEVSIEINKDKLTEKQSGLIMSALKMVLMGFDNGSNYKV